MCSLRDAAEELLGMGVNVYALSLDDVSELAAFADAQQLNFQLLSDPDGSATSKLGVLMSGRPYARRVTFVLDEKGVVRHVDQEVDKRIDTHGSDLVERVRKLRG